MTRSFTYSASGNVTLDAAGGSATILTYNSLDRLVRVSAGAVTLVDYVYAATGQRAVKATPTATTHYLYDPGGALYAEADGAGNVLREYITLGGATIAIVDAGGVSYVHNDHLATPQVMTDGDTAAVVWDASYRPFGEASIAGAAVNEQRFPGQIADEETGYHDNWHRTYDPSLGRYLQSDPIGIAAGFNTYGYVGGNPVGYADPEGLLALPCSPHQGLFGKAICEILEGGGSYGYGGGPTTGFKKSPFGRSRSAPPPAQSPTTFANKYPSDPVQPIHRNALVNRNGRFKICTPKGEYRTPKGSYDFVVIDGQTYVGPRNSGHINLSRGNPVDYAGEVKFSRKGELTQWNNSSGHYLPDAGKAPQANFPMEKFVPVE